MESHGSTQAVPLTALIEEAQQKNPDIQAAAHEYRAASNGAKGAGALPDTQLMLQHLDVGSPRPFAGYTNSDFAYIGIWGLAAVSVAGQTPLRTEVADWTLNPPGPIGIRQPYGD